MYGIDEADVRYIVDARGKQEFAIVPIGSWRTALQSYHTMKRGETRRVEDTTLPGTFRNSLGTWAPSGTERAAPPPVAFGDRNGAKWAALMERMPEDILPSASPSNDAMMPPAAAAHPAAVPAVVPNVQAAPSPSPRAQQIYFPREFVQAPPAPVAEAVRQGVYFLRAWRQHSGLTPSDIGELLGRSPHTVLWHEFGYSIPNVEILKRYAEIFDCPLAQLTHKPGSNTQPWLTVINGGAQTGDEAKRVKAARRAPDDTDYPNAVLAHMLAGKTPLTAWRLHRRMTVAQLADAYGSTAHNIRVLEQSPGLRHGTIVRLCPILSCTPPQLLLPVSFDATAAKGARMA